jgi:NADH:ubiquinone oxidoreductase subunit 2 (subunit N)
MPLSELILGGCAFAQGLLLLLPAGRGTSRRLVEVISAFGFLAAALVLLVGPGASAPVLTWFNMLEAQPILRLPRAALFLSGLLIGRSIAATRELPEGRKREVLFLLTLLALLCDLLLLSRHALLSCLLLIMISWLGVFLSGLAFRGRMEGEAVLKFWVQVSVTVALGFGSVLVLTLISGGAHHEVIATQLKNNLPYSPQNLLSFLTLCLPYFLAGGIFPFHFSYIDRDQGLPWAVQLILTVMVQGAITLAVWKVGVEVFGAPRPGEIADGMRALQLAGLAGGFWLALFALSQQNSKRLFSALLGAQWFAILSAGAMPSVLGVTAVTYAFSSVFLWSALLGFTWARLQEFASGDSITAVFGSARMFRVAGLVLLMALAGPLCVPGFAGLPAVLHLLAAMIEQKSLFFLFAQVALLSLLCLNLLRVGTDLLFRASAGNAPSVSEFRYGALDSLAMVLLSAACLLLGFLWHRIFAVMTEAAKAFL